jgi:hypothetical protein
MRLEVLEVALPEEREQMVLRMRCFGMKASPKHMSYTAWTRSLMIEMNAL